VVGQAANGAEAIERVKELAPDVVLIDIAMPRMHGLQAIERIRQMSNSTKLIVLSMYSDSELVRRVLRSGASGYLLKSSVGDELLLAVRAASRGQCFLSPGISHPLVSEYAQSGADADETPARQLTQRQREVLQLLAEGHTNMGIANLLHLSERTVDRDRSVLMKVMGATGVPALVGAAIRHKLIFLETLPDFGLMAGW